MEEKTTSFSLAVVLWLQQFSPHPWCDNVVLLITSLGDPKWIFLYFAPLAYWLFADRFVGLNMLIGLVLSDWLNALVKFPARGDRPYWHDDRVKEFSVTCESGYGMPSGHCMVSACVLYILVDYLTRGNTGAKNPSHAFRWSVRVTAVMFVTLIAVSRMYVGAHFLGQVVFGAACGVAVGWAIVKYQPAKRLLQHIHRIMGERAATTDQQHLLQQQQAGHESQLQSRSFWRVILQESFLASAMVVLFPIVEFLVLSVFHDPLHSLVLAREGCEATKVLAAAAVNEQGNDEHARFQLERGPFMGVMRDAGVCFGIGVGVALLERLALLTAMPTTAPPAPHDKPTYMNGGAYPSSVLLSRAVIGLGLASLMHHLLPFVLTLPPFPLLARLFPIVFVYSSNYLLFAAFTITFIAIVPMIFKKTDKLTAARG